MMSQDVFSGDDDLYINLLQNIRMMMECPPSLGDKVRGENRGNKGGRDVKMGN